MGTSDVEAEAYFKEEVEEEPEVTTYTISVTADVTKGSASADKTSAEVGEEITVTAEENQGYQFSHWNVTGIESLSEDVLTKTPLTFIIGTSDVVVEAIFEQNVQELFLYTVENNQVTITGMKDTTLKEIVIPSEISGYPVVAIGANAFLDYTTLTYCAS